MAKRSKATQNTLDRMNYLLSLKEVDIWMQDGRFVKLPSDHEKVQIYKSGICTAIETMLHESKSYKGYMFLDNENYETKRCDRKYF